MAPDTSTSDLLAGAGLLQDILDISLAALGLLTPLYGPDGKTVVDFRVEYLNLAGQELFGLPERPATTLLAVVPPALAAEALRFCCRTFEAAEAGRSSFHDPADALRSYVCAARRCNARLLVSVQPAASQLAASPPALPPLIKEAVTEVEAHSLLQSVLRQAPIGISLYQGNDLVVAVANDEICAMWGYTPGQVLGRPLFDAMPELRGQGFEHLLAGVARTRIPYRGTEVATQLLRGEALLTHYFTFIYQPLYDAAGEVTGILNLALDVTAQVEARQQLQQLNAELEDRVAERTQTALAAQAEAELQRGRLERLFMAAPVVIGIFGGPELVHELANPLYQDMVPGRALLGQPLLAVVPELVGTEIYARMRQVYDMGVIHHETHHRLHARSGNSADRYFNITYKPRRNEHGRVDGLLLFAFEVTEQVMAQERANALQAEVLAAAQRQVQERETFYQIFEQTPARIALLRGPEHRFTYTNESYRQLFPTREILGRTAAEVMPEAAKLGFVRLLDGVYQTGKTYYGNERAYTFTKPGDAFATTAYFNFTYQAYRENNQTVGVSIFSYDVSEQVKARLQQQDQQQQLRELFEQAPLSICLLNGPDLVYELVSGQHQELFPDRQLLGRPLLEAVPELAGQPIWHTLQQVYRTGETRVDLGVRVPLARTLGGELTDIYLNYIFQVRRDKDGAINGVLMFAFEVTEQIHSRQQVQQLNQQLAATNIDLSAANQQLTRANSDLANFIYTASHDLKTPISNIEGLLFVLRDQLPDQVPEGGLVRSVLGMMHEAVERFQTTIAQLTDITRLQQTHGQPPEVVELPALVEHVRLDLQTMLAAAGGQLTLDVSACPTVVFSRKNLRSILYNLLSNAIKYRAPDRVPHVQLRAYPANGYVVLEVQDNGLGLSEKQQTNLFGLFQRYHDHVEGSGVGLYMVKKIIDNADGTITVQSQPGIGSTFTVRLPA